MRGARGGVKIARVSASFIVFRLMGGRAEGVPACLLAADLFDEPRVEQRAKLIHCPCLDTPSAAQISDGDMLP
jgi:hypothetical protein